MSAENVTMSTAEKETLVKKAVHMLRDNLQSVQPNLPFLQLLKNLREKNCDVKTYSGQLGEEIVSHERVKEVLTEFGVAIEKASPENINADIIITGEPGLYKLHEAKAIFVQPRKLSPDPNYEQASKSIKESNLVSLLTANTSSASDQNLPQKIFKDVGYFMDLKQVEKVRDVEECKFWKGRRMEKVVIKGKVVNGFKRGSRELGVPTANIEMTEENKKLSSQLIPGVYIASGKFPSSSSKSFLSPETSYKCALSIGYNPSYDNPERTIEVYIVEDFGGQEFYGEELEVEIVGFVRAEVAFADFADLIVAIHCDIVSAIDFLS